MSDAQAGEAGSILVVDDDPDLRDTISYFLTSRGFAVTEAGDGQTCRSLVERDDFDLALIDLRMPGEDGISLCRHLRETTDMGLIILTGSGDEIDRVVGLEVGADDYVSKPFQPRELLARVRSVIRRTSTTHKPAAGDTAGLKALARKALEHEGTERVLLSVLFTDIVDSTRRATDMGDQAWSELLEKHNAIVRMAIGKHDGLEVKALGDGFLTAFEGPRRALRCAMQIQSEVAKLGIEVRAGMHTGECEIRDDDLAGIAVHLAARIAGLADGGELLVSGTVKDLVMGSDFRFEDRGKAELKGLAGDWQVFAVMGQ
ncbi:MAG: response regulator [Pseudomonadota bacterium]